MLTRFLHHVMKINKKDNNLSFSSLSPLKTPLGAFYNANSTIPTFLIETGVTLGRAFEANKRGGKKEAFERLVEQGTSAVVWIWGVQLLNKIGNIIGKNIFKTGDLNFDIGFDELRNPVKNNNISAKQLSYKAGNILTSATIATIFIGFILPKINQKFSSKFSKKDTAENKYITLAEYKNNLSKKSNQVSFKSFKKGAIALADTLSNNSTARLLITDTGVIAGRFKNARNKYEKIENLFRDISSIYFYLFFSNNLVKGLNKLTKNTNINPCALECTADYLIKNIQNNKFSKEEFINFAIGKNINSKAIDELFKEKSTIKLDEFLKIFPNCDSKAELMSELQPVFNNNRIISKKQAVDILNNGILSDPIFLKKAMNMATKGISDDKKRFVSRKNLENIRKSIDDFAFSIANYAQKHNIKITKDLIEKLANKNIFKNFAYNSIGLILSSFILGIVIPKVQYFISKKISKKEGFPGDFKD